MANDKVILMSKTSPQDALLEVLREGARQLLNEAEVQDLLDRHSERASSGDGRTAVVRNGQLSGYETIWKGYTALIHQADSYQRLICLAQQKGHDYVHKLLRPGK